MDDDLIMWILEFLLRQPTPTIILRRFLSVLPLPDRDSRLKKTLLLRHIQDGIQDGSISESVLDTLEIVQVLDGVAVTASMRAAYCAVAVCCTLDHVGGDYFSAVKRIWRGRVDPLEGNSGLFSDELAQWRDEIESAALDENVQRNLVKKRDAREHALRSLKTYLEEAWALMGPPFVEAVTKVMMGMSTVSEKADQVMHDSTQNLEGNADARVELGAEMVNGNLGGNARERVQVDPQLADNVVLRVEVGPQQVQGFGDQMVADDVVQRVQVASPLVIQQVHGLGDQTVADNVDQRVADLGGGVGGRLELAAIAKAICPEQVSGNKQVGPRKKQVAPRKRIVKRAVIVDLEDSGMDASCARNDCLPSLEVRQVQEALKTSIMELQAKVKDPLPDALNVSEAVRSELQRKHMNDGPSTDKDQHRSGVGGESSHQVNQNTVARPRPSLLEWNATAQTYEWSDSDASESSSKRAKKIHLPSPNRIDCPPLKNVRTVEKGMRRQVKRWSVLEEETLRMGVQRFGEGRWKAILSHYEDVFEDRTDTDLRDKWRNLMKYSSSDTFVLLF